MSRGLDLVNADRRTAKRDRHRKWKGGLEGVLSGLIETIENTQVSWQRLYSCMAQPTAVSGTSFKFVTDPDTRYGTQSGNFRRGPVTSHPPLGLILIPAFQQPKVPSLSSSYSTTTMSPSQEGQEKPSTAILKERRFKLSRCVQHTLFVSGGPNAALGHVIAAGERRSAQ